MVRKIGQYEIKQELGRGGMGTVYLARDPRLGRDVAIKVLRPKFYLDDPEFSTRFDREARTVASLSYRSIVPIYEYGDDGEWRYFVMPYMVGGNLWELLEKGPLSLEEAARIVERIGTALDIAHSKGIYHRDIKPGNILFDEYGDAFLSDFGIVKLDEDLEALTLTGATLGTPHYMSPEQVDNKDVDGRSDIYALGVVLYEMLSGQKPYTHDSPHRLLIMHLVDPIPDILEFSHGLPSQMTEIIRKAMAKNPADRYQSGEAMKMEIVDAIKSPLDAQLSNAGDEITYKGSKRPRVPPSAIKESPPGQEGLDPSSNPTNTSKSNTRLGWRKVPWVDAVFQRIFSGFQRLSSWRNMLRVLVTRVREFFVKVRQPATWWSFVKWVGENGRHIVSRLWKSGTLWKALKWIGIIVIIGLVLLGAFLLLSGGF